MIGSKILNLKIVKKQIAFCLFLLGVSSLISCHKIAQVEKLAESSVIPESAEKVSFNEVILRIEGGNGKDSKLARLDFEFYGSETLNEAFENQKQEIKNLILIHFANSSFSTLPSGDAKKNDPQLSNYLNQFLYSGQIDRTEYKLVKVY